MTQAERPRRPISILFAFPVAGPSLELHRFVVERFLELGESGGTTVYWRPIASTTLADPIYKSLRSPELVRRDHNDARKYLRYCREAGGEDLYIRGEYLKRARMYEIRDDQRPALVLKPKSSRGEFAILRLAPAAFETAARQRTLGCFLYEEIGEDRVRQFMKDGTFDAGGIVELQKHLDSIASFVAKSIARDRDVSRRHWDSYLAKAGLVEGPDPEVYTKARAWRQSGSLLLSTETNGTPDGKVEFSLQENRFTLQMQLMWRLLQAWPRGLTFEDIARGLYEKDIDAALHRKSTDELTAIAKCVSTLVRNIRYDKLYPAGINPEILPSVSRTKTGQQTIRLKLASLDRHQLGHLSRPQV